MDYLEVQERIYEQLAEWRETYGWDFSLRKQGRKGARTNRFIGKETGGYFGTTFWDSSTQYGGQPVGFVTLLFRLADDRISYEFEIRQSDAAEGEQNELAAAFLRRLQANNHGLGVAKAHNKEGASIMYLTIRSKRSSYGSLIDLFDDLKFHLKDFIDNFDAEIILFKEDHPDFALRRLEPKDTKIFEESYRRRLERYGGSEDSEEAPGELSVEQWLRFLRDPEVFTPKEITIINAFYHSPGHTNTTTRIDSIVKQQPFELGEPGPINIIVYYITQRIEHRLTEPFNYMMRENGKPVYYSMLFTGKRVEPYWEWTMLPKLVEAYRQFGPGEAPDQNPDSHLNNLLMESHPLNQILYGPPGTGKTYATIAMAVRIANPDFTNFGDREALHKEFRRLKEVRRIAFTTFHQSLSYEDFVEGLKPKIDKNPEERTGDIEYEIKRGIFREVAIASVYSAVEVSEADQQKTALNFAEKYDAFVQMASISLAEEEPVELRTWQDKKVFVRELSEKKSMWIYHGKEGETKHTVSRQRLIKLNNKIKEKGEITNINKFIPQAIGGANYSAYYAAWKAVNEFEPQAKPSEHKEENTTDEMADIISGTDLGSLDFNSAPAHVLIIDEINRGNVSAILGELITLLEPDKRLGAREALTVTLPYSREEFGVPPNLYLIGTMNTADRSVEALDAALRRRFTFREVAPNPQVIRDVHETQGIIPINGMEEPVDLAHLLTLLNRRIKALKDGDHQIGHSYFLGVKDWEGLASAFNDRIIPLLREYFFANYGQLQLVVGKGFCAVDTAGTIDFAEADEEVDDYAGDYKSYHFPAPATEAELATALRQLGLS